MATPSFKMNCSEILPRLYLGDLITATMKREMVHIGITDLLSIETRPLQAKDIAPSIKRYLYISAMDHPSQDIISHFETSYKFINEALADPRRKVYVHCVAGISRSATLIIAYVMKSKAIPYSASYEFVLSARNIIRPNEGFTDQLKLYQRMKCNIDLTNKEYRFTALESLVFEYRVPPLAHTTLINDMTNTDFAIFKTEKYDKSDVKYQLGLYFNKLHLSDTASLDPHVHPRESAYKCANCRSTLFYSINVVEAPTIDIFVNTNVTFEDSHVWKNCQLLFVEPQPWMGLDKLDRTGNILCHNCQAKIGHLDWKCEQNCMCQKHAQLRDVSMIKILAKKVDPPS